jgi:hypothetical protein
MATRTNTSKSGTSTRKTSTASKAAKQTKAPAKTPAPAPEPEVETRVDKDAEIEALKKQLAEMQKMMEAAARPQVVQIGGDTERVQFLWQAEVADDNVVTFGDGGMYGRIVGKTGTFSVPKTDLSRLLDSMNRFFLDKRWLIVVDGLDENEREMLGVNYSEGEILDRKAFARMVELEGEILEIYPKLCASHKEMVAKRYNEAYQAGNPHVKREVVVELNRMSKAAGSKDGDFTAIIEAMNEADAK